MAAPRLHDALLAEHLASHRQMAFVSGPRQVGKTTTCRLRATAYVNWDSVDDRELILSGPGRLVDALRLDRVSDTVPVVLFDELHKFPRWKQFLKGLFDTHADRVRIVVAGSSRMNVYRRGGDSLMGRYFVEVKHADTSMSPSLKRFQDQLGAPFAFQVTVDSDYVDRDCFAAPGPPLIVPARTFLSQLL